MRITFTEEGWEDYLWFQEADCNNLQVTQLNRFKKGDNT
jgi:hypothetical protein